MNSRMVNGPELYTLEAPKEKRALGAGANARPLLFSRGQLVEVRGMDEILATLDANGTLDGLPIMPEMAKYCGRRFRVFRRADKTCVEGYGVRLMGATVFLEGLRCDGSAHEGCQRNCLIFWKEAWLKPVAEDEATGLIVARFPAEDAAGASDIPTRKDDQFFCQSTELARATRDLPRWNLTHFVTDLLRRELSLRLFFHIVVRMASNRIRRLFGFRAIGNLAGRQRRSAKGDLDLRPGEWVEVKSAAEIQATLDSNSKNCGLTFEPDMLQYCGRRFEVDFPIRKIILEETGRMADLTHTVVLKGVTCQGLCAKNCPRSNPLYWREAWLRRLEAAE